jgi:hypothetical protein
MSIKSPEAPPMISHNPLSFGVVGDTVTVAFEGWMGTGVGDGGRGTLLVSVFDESWEASFGYTKGAGLIGATPS